MPTDRTANHLPSAEASQPNVSYGHTYRFLSSHSGSLHVSAIPLPHFPSHLKLQLGFMDIWDGVATTKPVTVLKPGTQKCFTTAYVLH